MNTKEEIDEIMTRLKNDEHHFVRHEWEEFLEKLSSLDDPALRNYGLQELELIRNGSRS